jgi:hypothetical protein
MAAGSFFSPAELIELIIESAPKLRDAGVVGRVELTGVASFELAAPAPPDLADDDDVAGDELDVLDDPDTYGGRVPRRSRRGDEA